MTSGLQVTGLEHANKVCGVVKHVCECPSIYLTLDNCMKKIQKTNLQV